MRQWPVGLVLWLLALAVAEVVVFMLVWRFFVQSQHGQLLDTVALTGNSIGQARVADLVGTVLNAISALSLAVATTVVGFIALVRRRIALAFGAVLLIVGANLTTQIAKQLITRPELGVDLERAAAGNSLPSGHTTVAASVAVALILVLPSQVRGAAAVIGAAVTALAGTATLSAGWHRPSDAVAAVLIVGAWSCAAGLVIVVAQGQPGAVGYGPPHRTAVLTLAVAGVVLLAGGALTMAVTNQALPVSPEELSRYRLLTAYAGGAMGIAGTAALILASVLASVHRVVPQAVPQPVATDGVTAGGWSQEPAVG
jgi:membrane-associated phospholipid phosphatase